MLMLSTNRLRSIGMIALIGIAFGLGNLAGWIVRPAWASQRTPEFDLLAEAWTIVLDHFVDQDQIDEERMLYGAIEGMLNTLGDENHTGFMTPEVARMQAEALEGSFEGIGAQVSSEGGEFRIIAPIRGSPAAY